MSGSSLPASITNTVKDSSVSRLAKTPAAVPPPTITKSKVPKPTKLCYFKVELKALELLRLSLLVRFAK